MTAEALALHFIDNLDAKLAALLESYRVADVKNRDQRWGDYSNMLSTRVYYPKSLDGRVEELDKEEGTKKSGELF